MSFFNGVTPNSVEEAQDGFNEFKIGENNAYIRTVHEITSKNGNPMLEITFATEDEAVIKYYIVDSEYKLSKLKQLYKSFSIPPEYYINISKWLYKEGVVVCKQDTYNGRPVPKVSYLKSKDTPNQQTLGTQQGQGEKEFTNDIPF